MGLYKELFRVILDIIYPRRCPACGDIVKPRGKLICDSCEKIFQFIESPRCMKCSKPIDNDETEYCYDCKKNHHHYKNGFAIWVYNKEMRKSIAEFKYKGRVEYVDYFVSVILDKYSHKIKEIEPDVLVPIPLHHKKLQERGFNQAEVLAKALGKELNIPVEPNLLIRNKYTQPQKQLSNLERTKNLEKAFTFSQDNFNKLQYPVHKIMLIDDIYTTGSTIEACTKILTKNGIENVYFISLCIGKGF